MTKKKIESNVKAVANVIGTSKYIKDYLHLYQGCEFICNGEKNKLAASMEMREGLAVFNGDFSGSGHPICYWADNSAFHLILRNIDNITKDEAKEAYEIIHKAAPKDSPIDTLEYIIGCLYDECRPELWMWCLKKGFDLFGLIKSGLAYDKKEVDATPLKYYRK